MKPSINIIIACLIATILPSSTFASDQSKSGKSHKIKISEMDTIIFCNSHKSGRIKYAREHGANLFGSKKAFYKNYHRIQCPPYYPSPLYHSIEGQSFHHELINELDYIGKFLTKEERQRLLNRPDKGRRKVTMLDVADIGYRRAVGRGFEESEERYQLIRKKLEELGAKRVDEMTAEELAQYD